MNKLTISIINYKTKELTEKCLDSILKKKWKTSFEICLVDNASNDGSVEYLKKKFSSLKIIESKENLGFAGGHNLVLKNLDTPFVLLLNSDTEVLKDSIDEMVEFMEKGNDIGIGSCRVVGFDDNLQPNGGDEPNFMSIVNWLFNLEVLGIKSPSFHRMEEEYYEKVKEVGWVSGNFMMIKKQVLEKIGLFNDNYFMYFEDAEFCYRAKKNGFKVMINPQVSIKHLSGGSLDKPRFRQWLGEYKGLIRFYREQFGELSSLVIKTLVILTTALRIVAFTLIGKLEYAKTYGEVLKNI